VPGEAADAVNGPEARATALLRTAYLLTGERAAAEDLVLAALVAAGPSSDDPAELRRALVAEHVGRSRRQVVGEATAMFTLPGSRAAGPVSPGAVAAALARLPGRTRAVLVLRYGEDLSEEATGRAVGRPPAAVAALTAQGLARLGELLPDPDLEPALRHDLARRAAEVDGPPAGLLERLGDDRRVRRAHRVALALVAVVLVAVVLLVAATL
jgi:DNA-directed RNA polymerase specialized sigma24 family protein